MSDWLELTYRTQRERLFRLAWLLLRDVALAEDAVHNAFVRMAKQTEPPNPEAYALRAVRNAAIDLQRRRVNRNAIRYESEHNPSVTGQAEACLVLKNTLARLSTQQREVVEMHLRLEMSFREIAEVLEEPLSTISSRYSRAIDSLRKEDQQNERD